MGQHVYGAIVRESDDGFWVEVPDLPGCFGQGDTFMEAVESISDGIETHLAALAEDGMSIPEASDIDSDDGRVVYVYADTDGFTSKAPSMLSEAPCKNEASSKISSEVATIKHLKNVALVACIFTGITMCVSIYLSQWVLFVLLFIVNFFALSVYDEIKKLL